MHAHLIIGQSEEYLSKVTSKKILFSLKKVADLKDLNDFTKLQLSEATTIVIKDFDEATEETQNAFLKSLEEPQEKLSFVLTARNIDNILPTIVSRSEIIEVKSEKWEIKNEDKEKYNTFLDGNIGKRLGIISKINKREDAIFFLENLILAGHEQFIKNPQSVLFLENANQALKALEANGNVQLQLTNFAVNSRTYYTN
jgi:DNA polymerase III delta prime subunit